MKARKRLSVLLETMAFKRKGGGGVEQHVDLVLERRN